MINRLQDIPCPHYTPLLIASDNGHSDITFDGYNWPPKNVALENHDVCRFLVQSGADVNVATQLYRTGQNAPTTIQSYWKVVVTSGDTAWAEELLTKFGADANWPSAALLAKWDEQFGGRDSHPGFRETARIRAVQINCVPMAALLLAHGADVNAPELYNLEYEYGRAQYTSAQQLATPLSIAFGNALRVSGAVDFLWSEFVEEEEEDEEENDADEDRDAGKANQAGQEPIALTAADLTPEYATDPMIALLLSHGARFYRCSARSIVDA